MSSSTRPWHAGALFVALFVVLRFALPALGMLPRALTADEADALLGGKRLAERLADPEPAPLKARLVAGFESTPSHPRLAVLPPEKTYQRAVLEAPLPRWLGALGMGLLPAPDAATNLERAGTASALAVALALTLLAWGLRRYGVLVQVVALGALLGTPGVVDAALSSGYGACAILVMALYALALERVLAAGGALACLALGGVIGLALGVHPSALFLALAAFAAWAIRHRGNAEPATGTLPLPAVPLLLLLAPLVALVVLVLGWPALWSETGKRLGSWLLDFGSQPSPPHEVLGLAFDQATGKSAQAFTALLQWVAWTPLPILGLWLVGLYRAVTLGREGAWAPLLTLGVWLVVGALDGGLFGARGSLLALAWVPTAITAAHGARHTLDWVERRLAQRPLRLLPARPRARAAVFSALILIVPILQSARGTTLGMARQTGAELRFPLPIALVQAAAAAHPLAIIAATPAAEQLAPALEAAREGLSLDLRGGSLADAELLLVTTASGASPSPEVTARLAGAEALGHDPRPGLFVGLWRVPRSEPGRLDKQPGLPHN